MAKIQIVPTSFLYNCRVGIFFFLLWSFMQQFSFWKSYDLHTILKEPALLQHSKVQLIVVLLKMPLYFSLNHKEILLLVALLNLQLIPSSTVDVQALDVSNWSISVHKPQYFFKHIFLYIHIHIYLYTHIYVCAFKWFKTTKRGMAGCIKPYRMHRK